MAACTLLCTQVLCYVRRYFVVDTGTLLLHRYYVMYTGTLLCTQVLCYVHRYFVMYTGTLLCTQVSLLCTQVLCDVPRYFVIYCPQVLSYVLSTSALLSTVHRCFVKYCQHKRF
jgi:hypothetical protein